MRPCKYFATSILAMALFACAAPHDEHAAVSHQSLNAAVPLAVAVAPILSDFDQMRVALPGFDLERRDPPGDALRTISVVRDIAFEREKTFLSDADISKLIPLQAYLRAHPAVTVRIEGYGDGSLATERDNDLSSARAEAVARALTVDMRFSNSIVTMQGIEPQHRTGGHAEITLLLPH